MYNKLKIVKLANPTTVSFFLRLAGLLIHSLGLVLCILHVDLTLGPTSYVSSLYSISEAAGSTASVIIKFVKFSTGFTDAGVMSATILLTTFGKEGAFPPPVSLLSLLCSSNSFFVCIFMRFQQPCVAFRSRLFPSGFLVLKVFAIFSRDFFFLFNLAFLSPLFSISEY